jgi:hypothetical protein
MEVLDGGEWPATWPYRFTKGKPFPGTHCVGGWNECLRAGLEIMEKRLLLCSYQKWNSRLPGCPACSLVPILAEFCRLLTSIPINKCSGHGTHANTSLCFQTPQLHLFNKAANISFTLQYLQLSVCSVFPVWDLRGLIIFRCSNLTCTVCIWLVHTL